MNPAGIVFGPNATLDVQGAFHASTADRIELTDGAQFDALPSANDALLSTAAPAAFGFLGDNPATIEVDRSQLEVPQGETLSLVGGELTIRGTRDVDDGATLRAPAGNINLTGVASPGTVNVASSRAAAEGFDQYSDITLTDSHIDLNGDPGGGLAIRGGEIVLDNTTVLSTSEGEADGKPLTVVGKSLTMRHGGQLETRGEAGGKGSDIRVELDEELSIKPEGLDRRNGFITFTFGPGGGGDIFVDADRVLVDGEGLGFEFSIARISAFNGSFDEGFLDGGSGKGGDMRVTAREIVLRDSGRIQGGTFGPGDAGDITINAERIVASGVNEQSNLPTGIRNRVGFGSDREEIQNLFAGIEGDAGNIRIKAQSIELNSARIATDTNGRGRGGNLMIEADDLRFTNFALVTANGFSLGRAGDLKIEAEHLRLTNRTFVNANGFGSGRAGDIDLDIGRLEVRSGSDISTRTFVAGRGGDIEIEAESIVIDSDGVSDQVTDIASLSFFSDGDAGDIEIHASTLEMLEGANIASVTVGPGKGGDIEIIADSIVLDGEGKVSPPLEEIPEEGPIGFTFLASGSAVLPSSGPAGDVDITTDTLVVRRGATIDASTISSNPGGTISIEAASQVVVEAGGRISTQGLGSGPGGDIVVETKNLSLASDGGITASSRGAGVAGNVFLSVDDTLTSDGSSVSTVALESDGGNITLNAGRLVHLVDSEVSTSVQGGEGRGGNISIDPDFVVLDNSRIVADASRGPGGNIQIVAGNFIQTPDSVIRASSEQNIDGTVNVDSPETDISGSISVLPEAFLDATALLQTACAARATGDASSLVVAGQGGIAVDPDGYLPSFPFDMPLDGEDLATAPRTGGPTRMGTRLAGLACRY